MRAFARTAAVLSLAALGNAQDPDPAAPGDCQLTGIEADIRCDMQLVLSSICDRLSPRAPHSASA